MADTTSIVSAVVAIVASGSAFASQRAAAKASTANSRTAAEEQAYIRARDMDIETIRRQDAEIDELRTENKRQQKQIRELSERLSKCERSLKDCTP